MPMKLPTILALTLSAAFLTACGGGGGNGGAPAAPVTSTATFQVRTAYINYLNATRTLPFTLSGTTAGIPVSGSGILTQSSLTNTSFEGVAALQKTSTVNASLTANGMTMPLASTLVSYVDSNYVPLGSVNDEYLVVTGAITIPVTGQVNDAGIWFSANRYASSLKINLLGTEVVSYALLPDTASTALLDIIQVDKNLSGATTMTTTLRFRISPAGELTRLSEQALADTTHLTLTY